MKPKVAVLAMMIIIGFVSANPSYAATKSGDSCKSLGSKITVAQTKLICIKSGKKLVWSKDKAVVKQSPKASPKTVGASPTSNPTVTPIPTQAEPCVPLPPRTYPTVVPSVKVTSDNARFVSVTIDVATPVNGNRDFMIAKLKCQKIENSSLNVWFKTKYNVINGLFTSSNWVMDTFTFSIVDAQGELQLPYTYKIEIPTPQDFLGGAGKIRADFITSLKQLTGYNSGPYSNFVEFTP